jgi:hypothetical protein
MMSDIETTPKNAKLLWYVAAFKGHTTIDMPCWEGEEEAHRCVEMLSRHGWVGPILKKDKQTGMITRAEKPHARQLTIPKSHAHWREFLPSAADVSEQPKENA